jgi:HEAT repeat protein
MPLIRTPSDQPRPVAQPTDGLAAALSDASPEKRWVAARSAPRHADVIPVLANALSHEMDVPVREAIFTTLAQIGSSDSIFVILPYLRSDDASLRTGAMDALRAAPSVTRQHLPHLFADPDPDVRILACELARLVNDDEARRLLRDLLKTDPEVNVCAGAIEVLAEIGTADAVDALTDCVARFPQDPFLSFSVDATLARLGRRDT